MSGNGGGKEVGREEGTGKLTGQFSGVTVVYLPDTLIVYPFPNVGRRGFVQLFPKSTTHNVNMLKKHELEFKWHQQEMFRP